MQRAFQPMPVGTPWGAKWEYGWFKASLTLPAEAEGQHIVVRLYPGDQESVLWINARAGEHYEFLLESYAGRGVVREAYDLNVPVVIAAGSGPQPSGSFFSVDADDIVIETVKPAEDGSRDVIVRLYEAMRTATRCTLSTPLPDLLEEDAQPLTWEAGQVCLGFRPFEIKSVRLSL